MFYLRDGKWGVAPKKITYKTINTVYDIDGSAYMDDPKNLDVVVEDITLTEPQLKRFKLVRDITTISMETMANYVLYGSMVPELESYIQNTQREQKFENMVNWANMTQEDISIIIESYERWEPKQTYTIGKLLRYGNVLYKVLTPGLHIATELYPPDTTPSMYASIGVPGTIKEWEQRGSTNPYMKGDIVIFEGEYYTCVYDNTTHSPLDFPQGWIELIDDTGQQEAPPQWIQRWDAGYQPGDRVAWQGEYYTCKERTTYSPTDYPRAWTKE